MYKNSKKIIDNDYQSLRYDENNNIIVALKGKQYGVMTIEGKQILPFKYKQIDITGQNIYATKSDGDIKVFDNKGKETELDYNTVITNVPNTSYKINIAVRDNKTVYSIYKNNDKKTDKEYSYIEYLFDNYFLASSGDGKVGIIDENEKTVIKFDYNSIEKIENMNLIQAKNSDGNVEIYSTDMKKITELISGTVEECEDYIKLYNDNEIKYITKEGKEIKDSDLFTNNKIFPKKQNDKWGFVDKEGNVVINYDYEAVTEINEYGFAGVKKDGKWGVINNEGKIIIEPTYELKNTKQPIFIGIYYQYVYGNGEVYYTNNEQ